MPIFEFVCQQCRHGFEEILTHTQLDAGDVACPACGCSKVERALSSFATGSGGGGSFGGGGGCGSSGFG